MIYYISNNPVLLESTAFVPSTIEKLIEFIENESSIEVDTETEGMFDFKNKVIMLQIGNGKDQYVIDTRNTDISRLKYFMESDKWLKLFHNAKFDISFLRFTFDWRVKNVYDTFLNECILTTGFEKRELSLEALVNNYCGYRLNKEVRNKFVSLKGAPFTDNQIKYGAEDVTFLHAIMDQQLVKLNEYKLIEVSKLENKAVEVFSDIEYNGMGLDVSKWLEIAKKTHQGTIEYKKALDALVLNEPKLKNYHTYQASLFNPTPELSINWSSSTQVLPILKAIGLPVNSTSEQDILKHQNKHEIVKNLLKYKKQSKLCDAFGESFLKFVNPVTGRIHPSFWMILKH